MQFQDSDLIDETTLALDAKLFDEYQHRWVNANNHNLITYGTAGFRNKADYLHHGLIAKLESQKALGIVVTASHNPIDDNGIKQSDFDGTALRHEFELYVDEFVQQPQIGVAINNLLEKLKAKYPHIDIQKKGLIFIGRDTRPSSKELSDLIIKGALAVGSEIKDFGEVTTPMLHWAVKFYNEDEHDYTSETPAEDWTKHEDEHILLDASNGVGGKWVNKFVENMKNLFAVTVINSDDLNHLNNNCGAEHVHKAEPSKKFPRGAREAFEHLGKLEKIRALSFDGDADRIIYYLPTENLQEVILLDGDRMIALFAYFFKRVLGEMQVLADQINHSGEMLLPHKFSSWRIGMVQTGYANGSSTHYMRHVLNVEQIFCANGIKNLHPASLQFDIGCYCESNGHGTFHVAPDKMKILEQLYTQSRDIAFSDEKIKNFFRLATICYSYASTQNQVQQINQKDVMGDAQTNFLCIEMALAYFKLSAYDWLGIYQDKKCQNSKIYVKNKNAIKVNSTEDQILQPVSAQHDIDKIVKKYGSSARAFARPSGTEDYVRIYCEADDMESVQAMALEIKNAFEKNEEIN